jgi:hypothetical protein
MPRQIRARSLVPPLVAERQIVSGRVGQRFAHQPATHCNCDGDDGDRPDDEEGSHAARPCVGDWSAAKSSGNGVLIDFAANLRCSIREAGMPFLVQLKTVEVGAFSSLATAETPPR